MKTNLGLNIACAALILTTIFQTIRANRFDRRLEVIAAQQENLRRLTIAFYENLNAKINNARHAPNSDVGH